MLHDSLIGILRRLALLALLVVLSIPAPVQGQGTAIQVRKSAARPRYPARVTFSLSADSPAKINKVILWYGFTTSQCAHPENREAVKVQPGNTVNISWDWVLYGDAYMLPGMELFWYWDIYDDAGNVLTTEKQSLDILESRYTWKHLEQGPLRLYWASGSEAFGREMMDIAGQNLDRLAQDIGVSAPGAIRLVIYPSEKAMRQALLHVPKWSGGVSLPAYNLILTGIDPNGPDGWAQSVISHELAHLVIEERAGNWSADVIPLWLNEGLAQYAEGEAADQSTAQIMHALDTWNLPELKTLEERFPTDASKARLSYTHSRMVVAFMLETYGKEKLADLLDLLKNNQAADAALQQIYGLDTNAVDNTWRASLGFGDAPVPAFPTATPTRTLRPSATPRATATPTVTVTATVTLTPTTTQTVALATPTSTSAPAGRAAFRFLTIFGIGGLACAGFLAAAAGGLVVFLTKRK